MRLAVIKGTVVAVSLLAASSTSAVAAEAQDRCAAHPPDEETLLVSTKARVISTGYKVYGCAFKIQKRFRLGREYGSSSGSGQVFPKLLKGYFVALQRVECDGASNPGPCYLNLFESVDLRTGQKKYRWNLARYSYDPFVGDVILKPNGSVAWTDGRYVGGRDEFGYERLLGVLRKMDTDGSAVLASGVNRDGPGRLRREGSSTLHWVQRGKPFSAPLK
jgi:hypothetical protein